MGAHSCAVADNSVPTARVKAGNGRKKRFLGTGELRGKTLGVAGLGAIDEVRRGDLAAFQACIGLLIPTVFKESSSLVEPLSSDGSVLEGCGLYCLPCRQCRKPKPPVQRAISIFTAW
mgnify:CR=1 FL=1